MISSKVLVWLTTFVVLLALASWNALPATCTSSASAVVDSTLLQPKSTYGPEIQVIARLLESKHYKHIAFNDSLSSLILDAYLSELDNNRTYFLQSDIEKFSSYRRSLDDLVREGDVSPAYDIYHVFRSRYFDRMAFAEQVIGESFDYTAEEYYQTDREHEPWPASPEEMDALWRKIVKSQALSLKIAGKSEEGIRSELCKRYDRFFKNISQLTSEDVFNMYANAITQVYDPHTNYFSPQNSALFQENMSLSFEGIGARLQTENDYTKIVDILPGGPAQKSGKLRPNDLIVGVAQGDDKDMVDVIGWRISDVIKLIKGPKGTVVRLQILPVTVGVNGPPVEIRLTRDKIDLEEQAAKKNVLSYTAPSGKKHTVSIISLPGFYLDFESYSRGDKNYRSTTRDVRKLIEASLREGAEGVVLDLRDNGGGALTEAIDLMGLFIKSGPVVQVKDDKNNVSLGADQDPNVFYDGPLLVLTNRSSASASEILAAAVQDYGRGIVMGDVTYGKGTVQTLVDLDRFMRGQENIGQLKLTFQMFYRVNGGSTQHKGVIPDIALPSPYTGKSYGESAEPSALPWNTIQPVRIQKTNQVDEKTRAYLNKSYHKRLLKDNFLKQLVTDTEKLAKSLNETEISLNEAKRRAEIKRDTAAIALKPKMEEDLQDDPLLKLKDEQLRQSVLTLTELIEYKK